MASGTVYVSDGRLEDALRTLKKYFDQNVRRELRMRESFANRKKTKKSYAAKRFRKKERERSLRNG